MVSPDRHPEVLLDQPEPGVVDVREEQRPGADGQREQRDGGAVQPAGQRGDDAGGGDRGDRGRAGRQPDADGDQPAEHQRGEVDALAPARPMRSPTPESTSTCLNPPPAATMSRIPAIAGSAPPTVRRDLLPAEADGGAEGEHRDDDADQQRDRSGCRATSSDRAAGRCPSSRVSSPMARSSMSTTGSRMWRRSAPSAGCRRRGASTAVSRADRGAPVAAGSQVVVGPESAEPSSPVSRPPRRPNSAAGCARSHAAADQLPNTGPAMITAGSRRSARRAGPGPGRR